MGPVVASTAIAEQDGARITSPNHRQPPQDWGVGQDVNELLPRKGLVNQLQATLGDPRLCFTATGIMRHYVTSYYDLLLHITAYPRALAWSHSRTDGCHSIGLACPSIWTDKVKRSFKRPYQTLSGGGWASEDQVLLVVSKIFLVRKQPALQTLVSPVYGVTDWPAVCRKCGCGPLPASVITYYYY